MTTGTLSSTGAASTSQNIGVFDVETASGGLSVGYDSTNNWTWFNSRTVGLSARPMVLGQDIGQGYTVYIGSYGGLPGMLGVKDTAPGSALSVCGNAQIGFSSGQTSSANSLAVSGSLGIGTATPSGKCHISAASNDLLSLTNTSLTTPNRSSISITDTEFTLFSGRTNGNHNDIVIRSGDLDNSSGTRFSISGSTGAVTIATSVASINGVASSGNFGVPLIYNQGSYVMNVNTLATVMSVLTTNAATYHLCVSIANDATDPVVGGNLTFTDYTLAATQTIPSTSIYAATGGVSCVIRAKGGTGEKIQWQCQVTSGTSKTICRWILYRIN